MRYTALVTMMIGILGCAANGAPKPPPHVPFEPLIFAVKADSKMIVDGKDTEACYSRAPRSSNFVTITGEKIAPTSNVRVVYDDEKIYFFYDCYELPDAEPARPTDSVELFINGTESDRSFYYQIYAALNGNYVVNKKRKRFEDPVGLQGFEVKFQRKGKGFTCEIAISRAMFSQDPNFLWRVNFNRSRPRNDYPKMFTCWSPTGADFHTPQRFGYMILGDKKSFIKGYYGTKAREKMASIQAMAKKYPKIIKAEDFKKLEKEFKAFEKSLSGNPELKDGEKLLSALEKFSSEMSMKLILNNFGN